MLWAKTRRSRENELRARIGVRLRRRSATMTSMSSNPQIATVNFREDLAGDFMAGDALTRSPITKPSAISASTLHPEIAWKQLVARDPKARFVYGVMTTGVFCRPGCASRRPLRENVRFFETVVEIG